MKTNMLFWCISVAFVLLLSSCATMLNSSTTEVSVNVREPFTLIHKDSTYHSRKASKWSGKRGYIVDFDTERSKDSLRFTIYNQTDTARYAYDSKSSATLLMNLSFMCLGYIVDKKGNKQYTYPGAINLTRVKNPFDQNQVPLPKTKRPINRKRMITLNLGFPTFNFTSTYSNLYKRQFNNFSILGASLGVDYYHHQDKYFNITVGLISDASGGMDPPDSKVYEQYTYADPHRDRRAGAIYANMTHNHRLANTFLLGYGLSYGINQWTEKLHYNLGEVDDNNQDSQIGVEKNVEKRHVLGLAFNAHYMPGESFFTGIDYRPTFFRFQRYNKFRYEHLISLTFGWKIKLKRGT